MSDAVRLWLEINHHAAFRLGGWAYVRADGAQVAGAAGGDRGLDAERMALVGLLAALKDLPAGVAVELRTASPAVAGVPGRLAAEGDEAPSDNLDLWAQAMTALKARRVQITATTLAPRTPSAFAAAWAEQGRERAKGKGAFSAPIPKPNLASAGVSAAR